MANSNCNGVTPHTLTPNGLDSEPWTGLRISAPTSPSSSSNNRVDLAGFDSSFLAQPANLLRSTAGPHQSVPANIDEPPDDSSRDFWDFTPHSESTEEDVLYFLAVFKSHRPGEDGTVVVRTLTRYDVACYTRGCEGLDRLRVNELVKIAYHRSGEHEGQTFLTDVAAECTPTPSNAASRVGSRMGSRAPSRAPSRQPSRPPSTNGA